MKNIAFLLFCLFFVFFCSCDEQEEVVSLKRYVLKTYGKDTLYFGDTIVEFKKYWASVDTFAYRYDSFSEDSGDVQVVCYAQNNEERFFFYKNKFIQYKATFKYKSVKNCKNRFAELKKRLLKSYPIFTENKNVVLTNCVPPDDDYIYSHKNINIFSQKYGEYIYSIDFNDSCATKFYLEPSDLNYMKFRQGEAFDEEHWKKRMKEMSEHSQ